MLLVTLTKQTEQDSVKNPMAAKKSPKSELSVSKTTKRLSLLLEGRSLAAREQARKTKAENLA